MPNRRAHLLLVVEHGDAATILVDKFLQRHHAARTQQHVERNRTLPVLVGVDGINFVEALRQVGCLAHVVDGVPNGPVRRHGDELGLHAPTGRIFRIFEAALELFAFRLRQLFEDFFAVLLVERFQDLDGVVGFELADALGDLFRLQFIEDLLADGFVDLVQRGEVEIGAGQFDELDAVVGLQSLDQVAEVGFMEFTHDVAQERGILALDGARDPGDEVVPDVALIVPHRVAIEQRGLGVRNIGIFGHAAPRRFDRNCELV